MYIRYLGNIHNISNYNSLVKGGQHNNSILLQKDNGHFFAMEFRDSEARDFILNQIWQELAKQTICFDIDNIIDTYYQATKYNI
jgi:hypothetical protein